MTITGKDMDARNGSADKAVGERGRMEVKPLN